MKYFYLAFISMLFLALPALAQERQGGLSTELSPVYTQLKYHRYLWNPALTIGEKEDTYFGLYHRNSAPAVKDNLERYFLGYHAQLGERAGVGLALVHDRAGIIDLNSALISFGYEIWLSPKARMAFGLQALYRRSRLSEGRVVATIPNDPSLNQEPSGLLALNPGLSLTIRNTQFSFSTTDAASYVSLGGASELYNSLGSYNAQVSQRFLLRDRRNSTLRIEAYLQQREFAPSSKGLNGLYEIPGLGWLQAGYDDPFGFHGGLGLKVSPSLDLNYTFESGAGELANITATHGLGITYRTEARFSRRQAPLPRAKKEKKPRVKKPKTKKREPNTDDGEVDRLREELEEAKNTIALQRGELDSMATELAKLKRELNILKNQRAPSSDAAGLGDNRELTTLNTSGIEAGYYLVLNTYNTLSETKKAVRLYTRMGVETQWFIDKPTNTYYLFWKRFANRESAEETLRIITESDYRDEAWIVRIVSD